MDAVTRIRQFVILGVRLTGIVLLARAAFSIVGLAEYFNFVGNVLRNTSGNWQTSDIWEPVRLAPVIDLTTKAGIGAVLCIFSRRITRWLVPRLQTTCLGCGHRLDPSQNGRCPECGTEP
jgi:hypothetical protein